VDERHKISRVRMQSVRVHRQLAQLRTMFHRLEPRVGPTMRRSLRRSARWRRSSTPSTTRSVRCMSARGSCSTRSTPR
jgi:hypothetical protein